MMAIISYIFLHAALIPAFGGKQYDATGWAQTSFNRYQEICDLKRKTEQRKFSVGAFQKSSHFHQWSAWREWKL